MKKSINIISLIFLIILLNSCVTNDVVPPPMLYPKYDNSINEINSNLYVIGGYSYGKYLDVSEYYDSDSNRWYLTNKLNFERSLHKSIVLNDTIIVTGGKNKSGAVRSTEIWNNFIKKWDVLSELNYSRYSHNIFILNGIVYVSGGIGSENVPISQTEKYNSINEVWEVQSDMNVSMAGSKTIILNNIDSIEFLKTKYNIVSKEVAIIIGGYELDKDGNLIPSNKVQLYDPVLNIWMNLNLMIHQRAEHTAVIIKDKIYVIGGLNSPSTIEAYDIKNDEWKIITNLLQARYYHTTIEKNGIIYNIGGMDDNDNILNTMESYNTTLNMLYEDNPILNRRYKHTSILVEDRIYVLGGIGGFPYNSFEYYSFVTGQWYSSHREEITIDDEDGNG